MTDPTATEPTMEEILASIRQIISEDLASVATEDAADVAAAHDDDEEEDVLILTDPAPSEESPFAPTAAVVSSEEATPTPEALPAAPVDAPERRVALSPSGQGAVVARETAENVAASFERLSYVVESKPSPPPFAVAPGGATLEDITRELLKPVLKAWLDENLAEIVRARVDEEVERITRGRVR